VNVEAREFDSRKEKVIEEEEEEKARLDWKKRQGLTDDYYLAALNREGIALTKKTPTILVFTLNFGCSHLIFGVSAQTFSINTDISVSTPKFPVSTPNF